MAYVIGLVPAAGQADRLGRLPCSKEIFPLGFAETPTGPRPRPACAHLLDGFRAAGIDKALVLLRKGKWDIPDLLGRGEGAGVRLAYLALEPTRSVPETLDAAYPFVEDAVVALGFPDILFEPRDAYVHLLKRREDVGAEVVLALVATDRPEKADMVETDAAGQVVRLVIKERDPGLTHTWVGAVWGPEFSRLLHDAVAHDAAFGEGELYVGDVLLQAIERGLRVDSVTFPRGRCLDIGTPEDLRRAVLGWRG